MDTIGSRIKKKRSEVKMTQEQLGSIIGKSKGNISGYESGTFEPSASTIIKLAECFNISTDYILLGKEDIPTNLGEDELELITAFRSLDSRGRTVVKAAAYTQQERMEYERNKICKQEKGKLSNSQKDGLRDSGIA